MKKRIKKLEQTLTHHIENQIDKKKNNKIPFHLKTYIYIILIAISWTLYVILKSPGWKIFFALLGMLTMMYAVIIGVVKAMSTGVPWALEYLKRRRR